MAALGGAGLFVFAGLGLARRASAEDRWVEACAGGPGCEGANAQEVEVWAGGFTPDKDVMVFPYYNNQIMQHRFATADHYGVVHIEHLQVFNVNCNRTLAFYACDQGAHERQVPPVAGHPFGLRDAGAGVDVRGLQVAQP